jgi:hypothetical protein
LLSGGKLRISIDELAKLQSRPILDNEQWFPCQQGDYIELKDGVFGEVVRQTPEYVVVKSYLQSELFYKMEDFLRLAPQNFSHGFTVERHFTLPRTLRDQFATGLMDKLEKYLFEKLQDFSIESVQIIVDELNKGVIGLSIFATCSGKCAKHKVMIEKRVISEVFHYLIENSLELPIESLDIQLNKNR